jgi:predicted RNA-binding protein YlxR (DUF448 family)
MIRVGVPDGWSVTRGRVKVAGRGVYLCCVAGCVENALKRGSIERKLMTRVPVEIREKIELLSMESR